MALPATFQSPTEYFTECLIFFKKYEHLYNFANTELLIEGKLSHISLDALEGIDVFDSQFQSEMGDRYLPDFFQSIKRLTPKYDEFEKDEQVEFVADVPLSLKKKHEIAYLADVIGNMCEKTRCDTVIDFGSGLGYLDQQLFDTTDLKVLGLESSHHQFISAKNRQLKYHKNSNERVKYVKHTITKDSVKNIKGYVKDKFPNSRRFCLTGLHACADLTVDALDIFLKMDRAKSIIVLSCCYHRIEEASSSSSFKNFPLSRSLRDLFEIYEGTEFLRIPFLRLATQPQFEIDGNFQDLNFSLLARAALQLYGWKRKCKVKRNKRKAIRVKNMNNDFGAYIKDVKLGYYLSKDCHEEGTSNDNCDMMMEFDLDDLYSIWNELDDLTFKRSAVFILLQNYLQPLFEYFILYDRLVYLQENNIKHCEIKKILDSKISPRCLAIIAHK